MNLKSKLNLKKVFETKKELTKMKIKILNQALLKSLVIDTGFYTYNIHSILFLLFI